MHADELLARAFDEYGVTAANRKSILQYLAVLGARSEETRAHSIRVGILAAEIAKHVGQHGLRPKTLLWAGFLHDIGKSAVDPELLFKKTHFTDKDRERMAFHVEFGWRLLRGVHDYTAYIIVRHHQFGPQPYPETLPPLPAYLEAKRPLIDHAARLLALADYYDALTTRKNDKFGEEPLSSEKMRTLFLEGNRDMADAIGVLIVKEVLTFPAREEKFTPA